MFISELIRELHVLKHNHGDLDIAAWHYGGGLDDLMYVTPKYDKELNVILLEPNGDHESKERR